MSPVATDQPQPYFYPPNIPEYQRSNARRGSTATNNRSSRSIRDRRRSSSAISTHSSSQQKPKKCIGDYIVGKTLGKGASGILNCFAFHLGAFLLNLAYSIRPS